VCDVLREVHVPGNPGGLAFLPLCAKPAFVALLDRHEGLLERYIQTCLGTTATGKKKRASAGDGILIFIADGDVMAEALMAIGNSKARAHRLVADTSAKLRAKVDATLARLRDPRVKDVVHWADVESGSRFTAVLAEMTEIMNTDFAGPVAPGSTAAGLCEIQRHVKVLVKNLFDQRVRKARAAGSNITNVFTGNGLEMAPGARYVERYRHLERACLLELCLIAVGMDHSTPSSSATYTEMQYLTNDPQGMTYISGCLQSICRVIKTVPLLPVTFKSTGAPLGACLKAAAAETKGITFVKLAAAA